MPEFYKRSWDRCARLVNGNICQFITGIILAGASFVGSVAPLLWNAYRELDVLAQTSDLRSVSTAQALDALTAETRGNNEELTETLQLIREDLAVLKDRAGIDWQEHRRVAQE